RSEDFYAHLSASAKRVVWPTGRLKLCVSVGANFAVQINLFVLRGRPFHGNKLLGKSIFERGKSSTYWTKREGGLGRKSPQEVLLLLELKVKGKSLQANRHGAVGEERGLHGKLLPCSEQGIIQPSW